MRLGDGAVTVNVNAGVAPGGGVVGNGACVLGNGGFLSVLG
jgi:hypothetical protein